MYANMTGSTHPLASKEAQIIAVPDDERVWVPQAEGVWFRPLLLNTMLVSPAWTRLRPADTRVFHPSAYETPAPAARSTGPRSTPTTEPALLADVSLGFPSFAWEPNYAGRSASRAEAELRGQVRSQAKLGNEVWGWRSRFQLGAEPLDPFRHVADEFLGHVPCALVVARIRRARARHEQVIERLV